ncbi:MAG: low temperature requirement protein A [Planctomycetes bacterium]|nr:low temperature requirement protein A [Planctomycetota bacterium]
MSKVEGTCEPQHGWWQKPQLHFEEEQGAHRKVTWLELFYDLVFVVAIAQIAHQFAGHLDWSGAGEFVMLLVPVWWIWIGGTIYNERFESRGIENRVFFFLQMLGVGGIALFAHHGTGENAVGFALSYIFARGLITFLFLRGGFHNPVFRPVSNRYATGFILSLLLWTISIWVPAPGKFFLWYGGVALELAAPWFTLKQQASLPRFSTSKMPERYGLFTIIVLGEGIVGAISGVAQHHHPSFDTIVQGALALLLSFLLWWTYFDFVARRVPRPKTLNIILWSYAHLPLVLCIVAVGAASLELVSGEPHAKMAENVRLLFACSVAGMLCATAFLETRLAPAPNEPTHPVVSPVLKVLAGAVVLAIGLLGVPGSAVGFLVCVLCAAAINPLYAAWAWFRRPEAHDAGHYVG